VRTTFFRFPTDKKNDNGDIITFEARLMADSWLQEAASLSRGVRAAEAELHDLLKAHAEAAPAGGDVPWGDLLSGLSATDKLASAEQAQLLREQQGLRDLLAPVKEGGGGGGGGSGGAAAAAGRATRAASSTAGAALRGLRERQRRAFGALSGEERATQSALDGRMVVDAVVAVSPGAAPPAPPQRCAPPSPPPVPRPVAGGSGEGGGAAAAPTADATLPQKLEAVKRRVEALDAEEAGEAALAGWDVSDTRTGGAEDAAALASALTAFLGAPVGGGSGGGGAALAPEQMAAFLQRACALLPGRSAGAIERQTGALLRAKARRALKMEAVGDWRRLKAAAAADAAAAAAAAGAAGAHDASFRSGGSGGWAGPDALERIAAVEWRASREAAKLRAAAEAEAAAAAARAAREARRAEWLRERRAALEAWRAEGGGAGGAAATAASPPKKPAPPPPAYVSAEDLRRRAAAAISGASEKRASAVARAAAAAAAKAQRFGDSHVEEALRRARGEGCGAGGASRGADEGGAFDVFEKLSGVLPERATAASAGHGVSRREVAVRAAERGAAPAHAAPLASVKPLARGRGFAIGAAGARPALAMPAWRKLANAGK
jgi:hypothetical protein